MANANAHFDPKALGFLHDTASATPRRDSGNARALEKSGAIGKLNVAMYICLRTALWTLPTLKGNLWALLNRDQAAQAGQPAIQAADRLPRRVPVKSSSTTAASTGQLRSWLSTFPPRRLPGVRYTTSGQPLYTQ